MLVTFDNGHESLTPCLKEVLLSEDVLTLAAGGSRIDGAPPVLLTIPLYGSDTVHPFGGMLGSKLRVDGPLDPMKALKLTCSSVVCMSSAICFRFRLSLRRA